MKKLLTYYRTLLLIFIGTFFLQKQIHAQNVVFECKKTSWPLHEVYQIESFNDQGKVLEHILVHKQDTTQWFRHEYNSEGFEIRYYSIVNLPQFDYTQLLDSTGKVIASISNLGNIRDTFNVANESIETDEYGKPVSFDNDGNISFVYDSLNNKIKEIYINDLGDTTSFGHYQYDDNARQILYKRYKNSNNRVGELQYIEFTEYINGELLYKVKSIDYSFGEPFITEALYEKINCE